MKTIQFVKVNKTFFSIDAYLNVEHCKKVLDARAVMNTAKKNGWI